MKFTVSILAAAAVVSTDAQFTTGQFLGWSCKNNCGKSNRGFYDKPMLPPPPVDPVHGVKGVTITRRNPAPVQAQQFSYPVQQQGQVFNNMVFNQQGNVFQNNGATLPTATAAPAATTPLVFNNQNLFNNFQGLTFQQPSAINQGVFNQPVFSAANAGGQVFSQMGTNQIQFRSGSGAGDGNDSTGGSQNRQANNGGVLFNNQQLLNNQFLSNQFIQQPLMQNAAPVATGTAATGTNNLFINGQNSLWSGTQWAQPAANTNTIQWAPQNTIQWAPPAAATPTREPVPTPMPCIQGNGFGGCCSCDPECTFNADCCMDYKYWCVQNGIPEGAPFGWGQDRNVVNTPVTNPPTFPPRVPTREPSRVVPTTAPITTRAPDTAPVATVATPRPSAGGVVEPVATRPPTFAPVTPDRVTVDTSATNSPTATPRTDRTSGRTVSRG